jgi:TPR repeat protein
MKRVIRATLIGLCLLAVRIPAAEASYESGLQAYERGDYAQALKDWLIEAEKGDERAQHNVAVIYDSGRGIAPNPVEARKWYERAATKGLAASQNNLGMLFSKGRGVEPDQARAIELWTAAARRGYALAEFNLGLAYANGQGVEKDLGRARELFQSAAVKKLPDAQFALGQVYHLGFGVEPDPTEARRWFELAAANRYPGAHEMIAKLDQEAAAADPQQASAPEPDAAPMPEPAAAEPPQPATATAAVPAPSPPPAPAQPAATDTAPTVAAAASPPPAEQGSTDAGKASEPAGIHLWLGSLPSPERAQRQWSQMQESFADLLQSMEMQVAEVERDNRKFYRLLAGPVTDRGRGEEICRLLQERDPEAWCKVVGRP